MVDMRSSDHTQDPKVPAQWLVGVVGDGNVGCPAMGRRRKGMIRSQEMVLESSST